MDNYYSERDINMMSYLGSQIECYVNNRIVQKKLNNDILTTETIQSINDNMTDLEDFYIENKAVLNPKSSMRYYYWSTPTTLTLVPKVDAKTVLSTFNLYASKDTSRLIIKSNDTEGYQIYNITYSYDYLNETEEDLFFPQTFINKTETLPLLYYLSYIAPKIYLEICSSYVNPFFVTLFQDFQNNTPVKSGQTLNTINSWCQNSPYLSAACAVDKSNPRCACQKCYNNHSYQNRIIAKKLMGSDVSNTDPWCYYPQCAKGSAIKNQLGVNRSVCSNLSVAGIFINPSEYSNVNISNTDVSASAYNNNGINITSNEGCNSCTLNQDCKVINNNLKCVDRTSSVSQENVLGENSPSSKNSRVYLILSIITGVFIVLTLVISLLLHKIPIINLISTPVIIISIILCAIFVYLNSTKESFTFPDYVTDSHGCNTVACYSDNDCNGEAIEGQVCMYNECSIPIGSFVDNGKITDYPYSDNKPVRNCIITNLLYAPPVYYTGTYLYSRFINNTLYAFAANCILSFDGTKWVEKTKQTSQSGFNPYSPVYTNQPAEPNFDNQCFVYNNNIYLPNGYMSLLSFDIYNPLDDSWSILSSPIKELPGTANLESYTINVYQTSLYIYDNSTRHAMYVYDMSTNKYTKTTLSSTSSSTIIKLFIINNTVFLLDKTFHLYTWNTGEKDIKLYYDGSQKLGGVIDKILNIDDTGQIEFLVSNEEKYYYITFSLSDKNFNQPMEVTTYDSVLNNPYIICRNNSKYTFIMSATGEIYRLHVVKDSKSSFLNINPCYGITNFDIPKSFPINQI